MSKCRMRKLRAVNKVVDTYVKQLVCSHPISIIGDFENESNDGFVLPSEVLDSEACTEVEPKSYEKQLFDNSDNDIESDNNLRMEYFSETSQGSQNMDMSDDDDSLENLLPLEGAIADISDMVFSEDLKFGDRIEYDDIAVEIANWALNHNIKHLALNELLCILRKRHNLPKDSRTLLQTVRSTTADIKPMKDLNDEYGEYVYFGIENELRLSLQKDFPVFLSATNSVDLFFNVDGLPLYRSSSKQFWPILGKVFDSVNHTSGSNPFTVAIFHGTSKPMSVDEFLKDFVEEMCLLTEKGFHFVDRRYDIRVKGFSCDAPARAFIKCIKSHTGYYGCEKCTQKGKYLDGKVTFPECNALKRSDDSFMKQTQEEHHKAVSPLTRLPIGLVQGFPLDYMHLICLGVVKKLIGYWLRGDLSVRVSAMQVRSWSETMMKYVPSICAEFGRLPRSFKEIDRWKAVEFRSFLLYYGPVLLRSGLPDKLYHHFMLLSVATTILCCPVLRDSLLGYASILLHRFVSEASILYGEGCLAYNMHNLVHLCDDSSEYGVLDQFSCFQFESELGHMKKQLRSGNKALAQFCRRKSEFDKRELEDSAKRAETEERMSRNVTLCRPHLLGPTASHAGKQFSHIKMRSFTFDSRKISDRYALLKSGCIAEINNVIQLHSSDDIVIICKTFTTMDNFFSYPVESQQVRIYKVSKLSHNFHVYGVSEISCKCLVLPRKDYFVAMPMLHH